MGNLAALAGLVNDAEPESAAALPFVVLADDVKHLALFLADQLVERDAGFVVVGGLNGSVGCPFAPLITVSPHPASVFTAWTMRRTICCSCWPSPGR